MNIFRVYILVTLLVAFFLLNGCASMPVATKNSVIDIQFEPLYQYPGGYRVPDTSIVFIFESTHEESVMPYLIFEALTIPLIALVPTVALIPYQNTSDKVHIKSMEKRGQTSYSKLPTDNPFKTQNLNQKIYKDISEGIKDEIGCTFSSNADLYLWIWPTIYIAGTPEKASLILFFQSLILTNYTKKDPYYLGSRASIYYHSEPYPLEIWSKIESQKFVDHLNSAIKEVTAIFLAILQNKTDHIASEIKKSRDVEIKDSGYGAIIVHTFTKGAERIKIPGPKDS